MTDLKDNIEKYLKGQLGPEEMHALEKKALSDPFLFDALGGAESIGANDFLADIRNLDRRIAGKQKGIRPWTAVWRIAASIALLIGAVYGIYTFVQPNEPGTLAQKKSEEEATPQPKNGATDSAAKSHQENTREELLSLNSPVTTQPQRAVKEEAKPVSEPANLLAPATEPAENQAASGVLAEQADDLNQAKVDDETAALKSKEKIASADQGPSDSRKKDAFNGQGVASKTELSAPSGLSSVRQVIKGKVTDAADGTPIPGANVIVQGTTQGTVTDANGNYQLIINSNGDHLVVSFIGFLTREINILAGQSKVDVQLPADVSALSEVVVAGYSKGEGESPQDTPVQLAEPVGGMKAYNKYLENNLSYPQQALEQKIEGRVTVEFTVQTDGTPSDVEIIRGLEPSCNEEVIRLVKAGPAWKPSFRGDVPMKSTVRVRVKFKLPK